MRAFGGSLAWRWAVVLLITTGCCGGSSIGSSGVLPPKMFVTVDNLPVAAGKCFIFPMGFTDGALSYGKQVTVRNAGAGDLCLKKITWSSANSLLGMAYPKPKPVNAASCPGAEAALAPGQSLRIDVTYTPVLGKALNGQATLVITHNDQAVNAKGPTSLCFGISRPQISLDATMDTFVNVSAAKPETHCYKFGNVGNEPLCFDHAALDPANAQYAITEKPQQGECIPALGDLSNTVYDPKKLQVCVRYSPDATQGNDDENVVLVTNDPTYPNAVVKLSAAALSHDDYSVACTNAGGKLEYDFSGVHFGTAEQTCIIQNLGPAPLTVHSFGVQAFDLYVEQTAVDAMYMVCPHGTASDTTCLDPPRGLAVGGAIYVTVKFAYPPAGDPINGNVVIGFTQANVPGNITIPLIAGGCTTPAPSFGPSPLLWLPADVGQKAQGTFVIANQSCATLHLVNACITSATVGAADPCSKPASLYHGLAKAFVATDVPAWGLLPLELEFHPPNDIKLTANDLLNIVYCPGTWASGQCNNALATQSFSLQGSIDTTVLPPTLDVGTAADYPDAKVGQPLTVKVSFLKGKYDNGQAYIWIVKARPPGSKLWLTPSAQETEVPELVVLPDVPGAYTFAVQAQAFNQDMPQKFDWSSQAEVTITVN